MDSSAGQSTSFTPRGSGVRVPLRPHTAFVFELLVLALLTTVAAGLRLWRLGEIPAGFHVDEAFNLIDARDVIAGWRPVFLPANAGREVLYTYWQAALIGIFGDSIAVLRSASAIAGTLAVPATWLAARSLAPIGTSTRTVALLSAALLTGSYWHLHFSRFGIRAVLFTPFVAAMAWAWWRTLRAPQEQALRRAVLAGAVLGLAAYVHPAGRGLFAVPLAHALVRRTFFGDREALRRVAICLGAMLVVASPLLWFWAVHPSVFLGHAGEVSIVGSGTGGIAANLAKVLGSFNVDGDPARWRNLPGRPVFDVAAGAAFIFGIFYTYRAARRGDDGATLTLIWLAMLLIPTIVTDAAPNFSRAIGALPAACLLAAIGLERACARLEHGPFGRADRGAPSGRFHRGKAPSDQFPSREDSEDPMVEVDTAASATPREEAPIAARRIGLPSANLAKAIAIGVMLAVPMYGGLRTSRDYFQIWAPNPETEIAFDADVRDLAEWVFTESESGRFGIVLLSPETASHATVRAIAHGQAHPPIGVDTTRGLVLREVGAGSSMLHGTYAFLERLPWESEHLAALMERSIEDNLTIEVDDEAERTLRRVSVSADDLLAARSVYSIGASDYLFGGVISLEAAQGPLIATPGKPFTITLTWKAAGPTDAPLHTAVQLVDDKGELVASGDARPLGGSPPTDLWQAGDWIVADHELTWIEDRAAALVEESELSLRIGWYRLEDDGTGMLHTVAVPTAEGEALVAVGLLRVGEAR